MNCAPQKDASAEETSTPVEKTVKNESNDAPVEDKQIFSSEVEASSTNTVSSND